MKFSQLIIRKIVKIIANQMSHFKAKFDSWCLSVRLFVRLSADKRKNGRPFVRSDGV